MSGTGRDSRRVVACAAAALVVTVAIGMRATRSGDRDTEAPAAHAPCVAIDALADTFHRGALDLDALRADPSCARTELVKSPEVCDGNATPDQATPR
jgi:hypothetical protein